MNHVERLLQLTWLKKRVEAEMEDVRKEVEAHYHDRMTHERDRNGEPVRSFPYYWHGEKLVSCYFSMKKEKRKLKATCYDWTAAMNDDNDEFAEWLAQYVKKHFGELAEKYVTETGDTLAGVTVIPDYEPGHIDKFVFKPNWDKVDEYMAPRLPESIAGLLGGDMHNESWNHHHLARCGE